MTSPDNRPSLTPADLADLMASFTEVTAKLQASHEVLQGEVARLRRELGEANAQVERSRRLAALGEMAAGIAHEVRNPLGSIRLYARMLEEDLPAGGEPHATAVKIGRATRAVEGIVGDILAFSREFRLRMERLDPWALLDAAEEACRQSGAPMEGVRLVREDTAEGVVQGEVRGDAGLLRQALVNVIRNALEAMAEHGTPERVLTLRAAFEHASLVLMVRDTGPGVTPEVVTRMFNPFFTTRAAGTGLGLALVHRIVDAHGGVVRVRNNAERGDGPGACIEIVLPRNKDEHGGLSLGTHDARLMEIVS
ncbi:MAG: hypothetical protein HBSAPP03_00680 [Phycisphaerae bacterium]|nr:MAG: hypothetical protein HBSAPP03_00680 [Phycisphaerae bacterium]